MAAKESCDPVVTPGAAETWLDALAGKSDAKNNLCVRAESTSTPAADKRRYEVAGLGYVGQEHGCLTDWELMFCWSIAGQRGPLSWKQFSKLHDILEKVEGYADWPHDWPEEY